MTKSIESLNHQHRNITRLIELVEREIDVVERGDTPNVAMLLDIMQYITHYVDVAHHPLEERLIARFEEAGEVVKDELAECRRQHESLVQLGREFSAIVEAIREEQLVERTEFVRVGREFVEAQRRHMALEEDRVFPTLERVLSEDELDAVNDEMEKGRDPLFGGIVEKEYQQLYDYIMRSA